MSGKEWERLGILGWKELSGSSVRAAAEAMGASYSKEKRIWRRYKADKGDDLVHLGRGRKANRGYGPEVRGKVLRVYGERYPGCGPTLASQKLLEEDGICLDHETLRRWRMAGGGWRGGASRVVTVSGVRGVPCFGDLVQVDGSRHEWFEGRGPKECLLSMADDASGVTMALMVEDETRVLMNDWTVRYENRLYQVTRQSPLPPVKQRIAILRRTDRSLSMEYRGRSIQFREIAEGVMEKPVQDAAQRTTEQRRPPHDHPWRISFRKMAREKHADDPAALPYG